MALPLTLGLALWLGPRPGLPELEFMAAVEESVLRRSPHAVPPEPFRSLLAGMGADHWKDRDAATQAMALASRQDYRWLFWGRKSLDLEVAIRCNHIIKQMLVCGDCSGSGRSKYNQGDECWSCRGFGNQWQRAAWD